MIIVYSLAWFTHGHMGQLHVCVRPPFLRRKDVPNLKMVVIKSLLIIKASNFYCFTCYSCDS